MSMNAPTFIPGGLKTAILDWGWNCGPSALAAILRKDAPVLRGALEGFEQRRYMNPTHVKEALSLLGMKWEVPRRSSTSTERPFPKYGLAFIQWRGTWDNAHAFVQYQHTHWIAVDGVWVFDINNQPDAWLATHKWRSDTAKRIMEAHNSTGFYVRTSIEIEVPGGAK